MDVGDALTALLSVNDDSTRHDTPFATARDNGRVMTTYAELPPRTGPGRLLVRLALRPIPKDMRNVHDRWDRAGWVRLVPDDGPPVEMVRFMTSYGGATTHEVDVTHLAPLLQGHCRFEVFIDTWVSPAWHVDVDLVATSDPGVGMAVSTIAALKRPSAVLPGKPHGNGLMTPVVTKHHGLGLRKGARGRKHLSGNVRFVVT